MIGAGIAAGKPQTGESRHGFRPWARKRRAGVIRGVQDGNGKTPSAPTLALPPAPRVADVTALLSGEINRLLQAEADLMVRARAVGFLCNVILKSLEVGAIEERLSGKTWSRSTEKSDRRKAAAKVAQLEALAQLHREQPARSVKLSRAIVAEVARIEVDVSPRQAHRNHICLKNFLTWLGRGIELSKIDADLLERYQRDRLKKASQHTVNRELYAICAMLRQNRFRVDKPKTKPGKKTEQRDFTEEELQKFFAACEAEEHRTRFAFLLATGARPAKVIPSVRSAHVALLKKELDPETSTVTIRSAKIKPGQKKTTRMIRIPRELMDRVMAQAAQVKGPHVFRVNQSLAKLFDRICLRAGIEVIEVAEFLRPPEREEKLEGVGVRNGCKGKRKAAS